MSPGATTRLDRVASMRKDIAHLFPETHQIFTPARIESGEILFNGREILVRASGQTNAAGIADLKQIVSRWGCHVR